MRLVTDDLYPAMNDPNERGRGPLANVGATGGSPSVGAEHTVWQRNHNEQVHGTA